MRSIIRGLLNNVSQLCPRCRRNPFKTTSYAQDGEDILLARIFGDRPPGFFVDVGAHHPKRFSNTYLLYERGWTGINIDPTPGLEKLFQVARPSDKFLEVGIAAKPGELTFHLYDEPAFNTFNEASHQEFLRRGHPVPIGERRVQTFPLATVLEKHLPPNRTIDLLSIDAEGFDLQVLESNDWERFRPTVVVVEIGVDVDACLQHPIHRLLKTHNYSLRCQTMNSSIYVTSAEVRGRA